MQLPLVCVGLKPRARLTKLHTQALVENYREEGQPEWPSYQVESVPKRNLFKTHKLLKITR